MLHCATEHDEQQYRQSKIWQQAWLQNSFENANQTAAYGKYMCVYIYMHNHLRFTAEGYSVQ